jgi:hypothetical protein
VIEDIISPKLGRDRSQGRSLIDTRQSQQTLGAITGSIVDTDFLNRDDSDPRASRKSMMKKKR